MLIAASFSVTPARGQSTGLLAYPSEDNIRSTEGTIEFWFRSPIDVAEHLPSDKTYKGLAAIVSLRGDAGGLNMIWFSGAMYAPSAGLFCSMGSDEADIHGGGFGVFTPEPSTWHHVAVAWRQREMWLYLDGELRQHKTCPVAYRRAFGTFADQPILFGDKWHARGRFAIDDLRVSSVARRPEELGFHGLLMVDPHTLLLDDFEHAFTPDGQTHTTPAHVTAGGGGLPDERCRFVDGRFGHAIALYPE